MNSSTRLFQQLESLFVFCIQWGSAAALLVPLVVTPSALYLYVFGKVIYFRIIVDLLVPLWVFLCIYKPSYRPNFKHPLIASLSLFIGIVVVTMFTGVDWYQSFWSNQERMTGVLTLLHGWLWFLMLTSTLKEWRLWRPMLITGSLVSVLVGLYGLGQKLHLNVLLTQLDSERMSATLGNPIFFGVYSLIWVFLSLYLLSREKHNLWRIFFVLSALLNLFFLFYSASRGVALAFFLSCVVFCGFLVTSIKNRDIRREVLKGVAGCAVILLFAGIFLATPYGKEWSSSALPSFANRLLYHSFDDPGRRALLQIGFRGFLDRPLTGWGWENFAYVNNANMDVFKGITNNPWNDHSHNQVVDIFALTGIFGGIAYLGLWFFLLKLLIKKTTTARTLKEKLPMIAATLLFIAYFVQNLTVFDTPAPLIMLYFSLALAYFILQERGSEIIVGREAGLERKRERESLIDEQKMPFPQAGYIVLPTVLLTGVLIAVFTNIIPFYSSQFGIKAVRAFSTPEASIELFKRAFSSNAFISSEFREHISDITEHSVGLPSLSKEDRALLIRFALEESEKNIQAHPKNLRYYLRAITVTRIGSHVDPLYAQKGKLLLDRAFALYPDNYLLEQEYAENAAFRKDFASAIAYAEKAVQHDIDPARSQWYLAVEYARSGDIPNAMKNAKIAMEMNCKIEGYSQYVLFLANSLPDTADAGVREYFGTLAVSYGRKSRNFILAYNDIESRAQRLSGQVKSSGK